MYELVQLFRTTPDQIDERVPAETQMAFLMLIAAEREAQARNEAQAEYMTRYAR